MNVSNPPGPVSAAQLYLLASATVDANALATTALAFQNGATATNSMPLMCRITRLTGTLALMVGTLNLNAVAIQPVSAVQSALMGAAADPVQYPINSLAGVTAVPVAGAYSFTVATINGAGATISVQVYGLKT